MSLSQPAHAERTDLGHSPIKIALLGCGTVGTGVAQLLLQRSGAIASRGGRPFVLAGIAVRSSAKPRSPALPRRLFTTDARALVDDPSIGMIVECIGGLRAAGDLVERAVRRGKHVVTANKDLLATAGPALRSLACGRGVTIAYEAAVGGAIPIVRTLTGSLAGESIVEVGGVLNGTTNFILDAMTRGATFAAALADAQQRGYAEADASSDTSGLDAAHKLAILMQLAFRRAVTTDVIPRHGIERVTPADVALARRLGYVLKLIAVARDCEAIVTPAFVHREHPFAQPAGVHNCIRIIGRSAGTLTFTGAGAGREPTASAVIAERHRDPRRDARPAPCGRRAAASVCCAASSRVAYAGGGERVSGLGRRAGTSTVTSTAAVSERDVAIGSLALDCGVTLADVVQRVTVYGDLASDGANAVLVAHALTGSSRAADWWPGIVGAGSLLDTSRYAVVGINALGGCYGSTGPASLGPDGRPYGDEFPVVSVADIVRAQAAALERVGIARLHAVAGGSLGGMQALQWACDRPERVARAIVIGAYDHFSPMGIGLNAVAREAIRNDPVRGIELARKIALLSYKSEALLERRFGRRPDRGGGDPYARAADRFERRGLPRPSGRTLLAAHGSERLPHVGARDGPLQRPRSDDRPAVSGADVRRHRQRLAVHAAARPRGGRALRPRRRAQHLSRTRVGTRARCVSRRAGRARRAARARVRGRKLAKSG